MYHGPRIADLAKHEAGFDRNYGNRVSGSRDSRIGTSTLARLDRRSSPGKRQVITTASILMWTALIFCLLGAASAVV